MALLSTHRTVNPDGSVTRVDRFTKVTKVTVGGKGHFDQLVLRNDGVDALVTLLRESQP